jgi:hypothetical protein
VGGQAFWRSAWCRNGSAAILIMADRGLSRLSRGLGSSGRTPSSTQYGISSPAALARAPSLAGIFTTPPTHSGDFGQKDQGVYLPVLVDNALMFFGDPHAAINGGIITGTGIECGMNVRARITLLKERALERSITPPK